MPKIRKFFWADERFTQGTRRYVELGQTILSYHIATETLTIHIELSNLDDTIIDSLPFSVVKSWANLYSRDLYKIRTKSDLIKASARLQTLKRDYNLLKNDDDDD